MMKRLLAIVNRTEDGFRGYVPTTAGLRDPRGDGGAGRGRRHRGGQGPPGGWKEGTNGLAPIKSKSWLPLRRRRRPGRVRDGMDAIYDQLRRDFDADGL